MTSERRLKKRLMRLYSVTVAAVLIMVFCAAAFLIRWDARTKERENFSTLLFTISDQLRTEPTVSHTRLRLLERENRLMMSIRDNGAKLLYNYGDSEIKRGAFERAEMLAKADGYDIGALPLTTGRRTSPVYRFSYAGRDCLGAISILPLSGGWRTVTLVEEVAPFAAKKIVFLVAGYLLSTLLLCLAGGALISRALKPALETRRRQTEFVAAASHELRSPLAVIAANAAAIRSSAADPMEAAGIVERETKRMSRLISDMLLLANADTGSWPVNLTETDADTVLLNAFEDMEPMYLEAGRRLTLSLPDEPLRRVNADPDRLMQVLKILIDNALDYGTSAENPVVELRAETDGRRVCLLVSDHGKGLSGEQKERVFERFYRGDAARRDKQHFGLGLSVARELVRLQNGRLSAEDTPGGGCTFRITL